jgi:hypothetical protein
VFNIANVADIKNVANRIEYNHIETTDFPTRNEYTPKIAQMLEIYAIAVMANDM